jgi:hypothetical protein
MSTGRLTSVLNGLAIPPYDHEAHTYTDNNPTTSVYRVGGASGRIVATVTRTFDDDDNLLTQVLVLS